MSTYGNQSNTVNGPACSYVSLAGYNGVPPSNGQGEIGRASCRERVSSPV